MKKLTLIFVIMFATLAAQADIHDNAGTSAGAFMKLGTGAPEGQALGNSFTALSHGTQALFWNPAGAAVANTREFQVSHMQWFQGVSDTAIAYIQPLGKTNLGFTLRYLRLGSLETRDIEGIPQNYTGQFIQDYVATVSLARTFFGFLDIGGTAKYINENNVGVKHVNPAFDVGGRLRFGRNDTLVLGFMGQNLGDKEEVPTALRGGLAFNTKYYTLTGELVKYVDDKARYGIGLVIHLPEDLIEVAVFDIRVGYYNRENTGYAEDGDLADKIGLTDTSKLTFGFGFYSSEVMGYGLGIDYAMMPSGALGTAHQLSLRVQF
ncbi:MAG: UPF0164 family protein [Elusimicrobiaceae bacterium]|nr:UPF0164 family protein [Elusimicrobiaceae bacterium]